MVGSGRVIRTCRADQASIVHQHLQLQDIRFLIARLAIGEKAAVVVSGGSEESAYFGVTASCASVTSR